VKRRSPLWRTTRVEFDEGTLILNEGQISEHFYLLLAGSVAVELRTPRFNICLQALGPGEESGWSAVLDHPETLFQIRPREPISAVRISCSALTELCRNRSQLERSCAYARYAWSPGASKPPRDALRKCAASG
jgi:CRP-like cAMP-binding protein